MGGRLISRCKCKWVFFPHFRVIYFSLCEGYYGSMILGRNTPEHSPKRAWLACASSVGLCLLMWVPTMDGPLWHLDSSTKGGYSSMIILPSHLEGWFCSKKREGGGKKERKKERGEEHHPPPFQSWLCLRAGHISRVRKSCLVCPAVAAAGRDSRRQLRG